METNNNQVSQPTPSLGLWIKQPAKPTQKSLVENQVQMIYHRFRI